MAVLERLARRIAQALHALGDQRVDVAVAVVAVLGQIAQEVGVGAPALQQFPRHGIHFGEAIVADDDVELVVGVGEGARHVVERDVQFAPPCCASASSARLRAVMSA